MKNFILALVAAISLASFASVSVSLKPGLNDVNASGEIAALEAVTVSANQAIALKSVCAVVDYTNCYKSVATRHDRYDFTVTNTTGGAAFATNVLDRFNYDDWKGQTRIVGDVVHSLTNTYEDVFSHTLPSATYLVTNDIASGSTSGHYFLSPVSNKFFLSGRLLVSSGTNDLVSVLLK